MIETNNVEFKRELNVFKGENPNLYQVVHLVYAIR